jgi:hypothetical protein
MGEEYQDGKDGEKEPKVKLVLKLFFSTLSYFIPGNTFLTDGNKVLKIF